MKKPWYSQIKEGEDEGDNEKGTAFGGRFERFEEFGGFERVPGGLLLVLELSLAFFAFLDFFCIFSQTKK